MIAECCTFADAMKYFWLLTIILILASCAKTEDEKAAPLLEKINMLYSQGKYRETLDSITALRERYPMAVDARKTALTVWQNASLKMAQADVAATDIMLQQTIAQRDTATTRLHRNMLQAKCDSLKARYEAMCGVVRMIHIRQKQK